MDLKDIYTYNAQMYSMYPGSRTLDSFVITKTVTPDESKSFVFYIGGKVEISMTLKSQTTVSNTMTCTIRDDTGNVLATYTNSPTKDNSYYSNFNTYFDIIPFKKYTIELSANITGGTYNPEATVSISSTSYRVAEHLYEIDE